MKKLFGLFVIGILSSTAMAELVCLAPSGCAIDIETGACPTCVETSIVEPIVESIIKSEIVSTSKSKCPNYFEKDHGGKTCEIQRNKCDSNKFPTLCDINFKGCKEIESSYNKRHTRNHGKRKC